MKKTMLIIVILLIVGIGIYYLVSMSNKYKLNEQTENPDKALVSTKTSFPVEPAKENIPSDMTVRISSSGFTPSVLTILPKTEVTWVNTDSVPHTITSDTPGLIESGNILPGQSYVFKFQDVGTIKYHCSIHPSMKGRIVVVLGK